MIRICQINLSMVILILRSGVCKSDHVPVIDLVHVHLLLFQVHYLMRTLCVNGRGHETILLTLVSGRDRVMLLILLIYRYVNGHVHVTMFLFGNDLAPAMILLLYVRDPSQGMTLLHFQNEVVLGMDQSFRDRGDLLEIRHLAIISIAVILMMMMMTIDLIEVVIDYLVHLHHHRLTGAQHLNVSV